MTALPTFGGKNGAAVSINDFGQAAGVAEEDHDRRSLRGSSNSRF